MSNAVRVALVLALAAWAPVRLRTAVPALAVGLWSPPLGVAAAALAWGGPKVRRIASRRRAAADVEDQVELLAELLAVGLSSGWGFSQALDWAGGRLNDPVRSEVAAVTRRMHHEGVAALDGAGGHAADLYRLVARALATGAPLVDAVDGFAADRMQMRRQRTLTAARRLPVILVFPLALLILPGFVLVTVAPALIAALERIGS
ncbi:MAG TPA: type II secretion system F family protein [Acidimicrobiia bacterium]